MTKNRKFLFSAGFKVLVYYYYIIVISQLFNNTTILKYDFHYYQRMNIGYKDEIRIPIQDLDIYTLPCHKYLKIVKKLRKV